MPGPGPGTSAVSWREPVGADAATVTVTSSAVGDTKTTSSIVTPVPFTLTGLAADSSPAGGSNPNWARRLGSVAAIFAGAALGALLVTAGGLVTPLVVAGLLVLAGTLACAAHPSARAAPAR